MSDTNLNWSRPLLEPGGSGARIIYFIPGSFTFPLTISRSRHRTDGPPEGIQVIAHVREDVQEWWDQSFEGFVNKDFADRDKATFERVKSAPQAVVVIGETNETDSLMYLRSCIGLAQAACDAGGIAVHDMEGYRWYTPNEWKTKIFDPDIPRIQDQIYILANPNDDDPKLYYFHTQGMRKFGRPDLAVENVQENEWSAIEDFFFTLTDAQMRGKVLKDGEKLPIPSLNNSFSFKLKDGNEDPLFNNMYLEAKLR